MASATKANAIQGQQQGQIQKRPPRTACNPSPSCSGQEFARTLRVLRTGQWPLQKQMQKNKRGPSPCRRERGKAQDDGGLIAPRGLTERFNVLQPGFLRVLNRNAG